MNFSQLWSEFQYLIQNDDTLRLHITAYSSYIPLEFDRVSHLIKGSEKDARYKLEAYNGYMILYHTINEFYGLSKLTNLVELLGEYKSSGFEWLEYTSRRFREISTCRGVVSEDVVKRFAPHMILGNVEEESGELWQMHEAFMAELGKPADVAESDYYLIAKLIDRIYFATFLGANKTSTRPAVVRKKFLYLAKILDERYSTDWFTTSASYKLDVNSVTSKKVREWKRAASRFDRYALVEIEKSAREEFSDEEWFDFLCKTFYEIRNARYFKCFPKEDLSPLVYKGVLMSALGGWNQSVVHRMITEHPDKFVNLTEIQAGKPSIQVMEILSLMGVTLKEASSSHRF